MKNLLSSIIFAVVFSAGHVSADPIIVNITNAADSANNGPWEVEVLVGSFDTFQDILMEQVWWETELHSSIAHLFAIAVGDSFGYPNEDGYSGPFFAMHLDQVDGVPWAHTLSIHLNSDDRGSLLWPVNDETTTWVIARSIPEPATFFLLVTGVAGLHMIRRQKYLNKGP